MPWLNSVLGGRLGVLQVVISYSGEPDQAVMEIFGFNEPDGPLAIVETTEDRLMLR